jgi:hypothetical protein
MPFKKGNIPVNAFPKGASPNPGGLPAGIKRDEEAEFRADAKTGGLAALRRIMVRAVESESEEMRHRSDMFLVSYFLVSYGFSKPPQLQDITATADVNVTKKIAMSFVVSDLAPPGSYIEADDAGEIDEEE